jgi:putative Holliday junction resolvase
MSTLLGFDYGTHRIGVAVGQTLTATATALTTLNAVQQRPDWERITQLITEWQPEALIVGLPFNMDDTETEVASRARRFARQLEGRYHLPVHLVDERLTSLEAERQLGGKTKQEGDIDALAAKLILETWLSEHT